MGLVCRWTVVLLLITAGGDSAVAQVRGVIADMETGTPVRGVKIYTNTKYIAQTDWAGRFRLDRPYSSVTIVHGKYVSLTLSKEEMRDTIRLLPRLNQLQEVVVWGKRPKPHPQAIDKAKLQEIMRDYTPHPSGFSFNFFSLFSRKRSKIDDPKNREILDNY